MLTTPRNSFVDLDHASAVNLAKLGLMAQGLRRIDELASEEMETIARLRVTSTCRSPMAEALLRIVAKSVGVTVDECIKSRCWGHNSSGWSDPSPKFMDAIQPVDVPALW
jgi:hypothetical protein